MHFFNILSLLLLSCHSCARSLYPLQSHLGNGSTYAWSYSAISNEIATGLDWDTALSKATAFVVQLNTSEKVNMVTGGFDVGSCIGNIGSIERLSFRGICFADGPAGVNRADL